MAQRSEVEARSARPARINVRASERQEQLIKAAAAAADKTVTDFVLDTAVAQAERVLADRRYFLLNAEQWDAFDRLLAAPLPATPKLDALIAARSPFTSEQ